MFHCLVALMLLLPPAAAGDAYRTVTLGEVTWTSNQVPPLGRDLYWPYLQQWMQPEVSSSAKETWLGVPTPVSPRRRSDKALRLIQLELSVRGPAHGTVSGELWLPSLDGQGQRYSFTLELGEESGEGREAFLKNRYLAYAWRLAFDLPGAAWFRNQKEATARELKSMGASVPDFRIGWPGLKSGHPNRFQETFDLFSGGRAVAENLALKDTLDPAQWGENIVDVQGLAGITIPAIDWKPLVEGKHPNLDSIAAHLPADQHAVFFPSFAAFVRVIDELRTRGAPVLKLLEWNSDDALTLHRYERQLALPLAGSARFFGPALVTRVALTGGDLHFRLGSDVAVLLETPNARALLLAIGARQRREAAGLVDVLEVEGQIGSIAYRGLSTPDRALCSYVAMLEDDVLVTNSLAQLARLAEVQAGQAPALLELDEYRWFRDRYRMEEEEDALVMVTDACIRRWCSARWRIGTSRRIRALARLVDRQASQLANALREGRVPKSAAPFDSTYGTLEFLTPVGELKLDFVTPQEARAYQWFRERYELLWRDFFDPLALRLIVRPDLLDLDLSVRPLAGGGSYRDLIRLSRGGQLRAAVAQEQPTSVLRYSMAISPSSPEIEWLRNFISEYVTPNLSAPLSWLGGEVSIGLEDDPTFWSELAEAHDRKTFYHEQKNRLPIAVRFSSLDADQLQAFLGELRKFLEDGSAIWETRQHGGLDYQVVEFVNPLDHYIPRLYLVALPDALLISSSERIIEAAIVRAQVSPITPEGAATKPRLGDSASLHVGPHFHSLLAGLVGEPWRERRQRQAWSVLPILDEWRRLFPDVDPLELHRRAFGVTLRGPDGGGYEFDEGRARSTSSVHGHPRSPRRGPLLPAAVMALKGADFGLTFEQGDGLRARVRLYR